MKTTIPSLALLFSISAANAAISLSGPSVGAGWIALAANYDFLDDQQTGDPASDIVGTTTDPGFFAAFDSNYALSPTQTGPALAFRVRLDEAGNGGTFNRNVWIGIDADLNGSLDAFIGVATPANNVTLGIYDAGAGDNISPSTTTIGSASYTYTTSAANYDYRAVNYLSDGGTLDDLTTATTGDTDYYVSCVVSFADVAAFLTAQLPTVFNANNPFTKDTPIRYVLATATQSNTLNQDLGGINNKTLAKKDEGKTWTELGGFSPTTTAAVPEVSSTLLALIGSVFGLVFHRRR